MADLLPCPFCGARPWDTPQNGYVPSDMAPSGWLVSVHCGCGAGGAERTTDAEAIEAWNTRHDHTADLLEALERIANRSGEEALPDGWRERLAWIEAELEDEPNRPLYSLDSEQPLCRNGHEIAELLLECIGLIALAALSRARNTPDLTPKVKD